MTNPNEVTDAEVKAALQANDLPPIFLDFTYPVVLVWLQKLNQILSTRV